MRSFEFQLRIINLKEQIASNADMIDKLVNIIGTNKGWRELSAEWKIPYNIVRRLKDMAICELTYSTRDFTMMRQELYKETVERIVKDGKQQPTIIINSPAAIMKIQYRAKKPVEITTVAKKKLSKTIVDANETLDTIQIKHDTNAPVFILGDVEQIVCSGCKLTECYVKDCPNLNHLDLNDNNIKHFEIYSTYNLKSINLSNNPIETANIRKMLSQLNSFRKKDLFDESPILCLTTDITDDIRTKLRQMDWRIIVGVSQFIR